jgi:hypothetical protein
LQLHLVTHLESLAIVFSLVALLFHLHFFDLLLLFKLSNLLLQLGDFHLLLFLLFGFGFLRLLLELLFRGQADFLGGFPLADGLDCS